MAWQGVVLLVSLALRVLNRSGVGSHDHTRNWGWESGGGGGRGRGNLSVICTLTTKTMRRLCWEPRFAKSIDVNPQTRLWPTGKRLLCPCHRSIQG